MTPVARGRTRRPLLQQRYASRARGRSEHNKAQCRARARGEIALCRYDAQVRALGTYKSELHNLWGLMWGRTNLIYTILLFLIYYLRLYGGNEGIRTLETVSRLLP